VFARHTDDDGARTSDDRNANVSPVAVRDNWAVSRRAILAQRHGTSSMS
jgi:hypothetical protein